MMTLKELKNLVKPADPKKRVPCAVSLKQSGARIVVREAVGLGADITVYANGYVLYQEGRRRLFFRCMHAAHMVMSLLPGSRRYFGLNFLTMKTGMYVF